MAKVREKGQAQSGTKWGSKRGALIRTSTESEAHSAVSPVRSRIMRSIRQKHTKPEILVRKLIHGMGFRFRLHVAGLPGRPDIVLRGKGKIIQVHGCFWHQHGCSVSNVPKTRTDYWLPKLARNVERDNENDHLLKLMGWQVLTVWECELKDILRVRDRLRKFLNMK